MESWNGPFGLPRRAVAGGWSTVLCCAVAVLPWATAVGAQSDGGIQVTVDRNQVALGTQIYMTVRIDGSPDEPPRLPELPDFRVVSRGQQRSTQIDNFSVSHSTSYNYLLIPTRAGTFDVGAATAVIDGVEVKSQPFRIEVTEAEDQGDERDRDLFVTANASTDQPWQGQQVIYTWRFYSRVPVGQGSIESMEFGNDVVVEDLGEVRQFQTTIDGVQYSVNEVRKALFPQRSGELTLPQTQLRVEVQVEQARRPSRRRSIFDDFDDLLGGGGRWVTKYLLTEPLTLDVRPLPPAPQGWNGLVGDFDIQAQLSRRELQVGQSATLEVQVGGTGNVHLLSEPGFPELPTFKIYPDQPDANIDRSGRRLTGRKVFRRALVPLVAGALDIPPIDLVYFDPE
ncbi:MAG: BatD family protein, partial [Acidobacteria bacterium]|nr:BatD family protein [Acidobacteriota bacterium]